MSTFSTARTEHEILATAAGVDEQAAAALWGAITTTGTMTGGFPDAVRDTLPEEHVSLVTTDDIAAAWAFEKFWSKWQRETPAARLEKMQPFELRMMAREVWTVFHAKATQVEDLAQGFGWSLAAAWRALVTLGATGISVSQVLRVAKLAGRMYAELRGGAARKIPGVPTEVYAVEQGRDVGRMLPTELAQLADPDLGVLVMHRLATGRLEQYAVRGTDKASKGPMVIALDESGSMNGKRNDWAKAAAIALARVALDEHRAFSVVHFSTSTSVQQRIDPSDPAAIGKMLSTFLNGGTSIGLALDVSVREVTALAARGDRGADVILVTDGIDGNALGQQRALDAAALQDVRLWLVAIECDVPVGNVLRDRAAGYARLSDTDMTEPNASTCFAGAV